MKIMIATKATCMYISTVLCRLDYHSSYHLLTFSNSNVNLKLLISQKEFQIKTSNFLACRPMYELQLKVSKAPYSYAEHYGLISFYKSVTYNECC